MIQRSATTFGNQPVTFTPRRHLHQTISEAKSSATDDIIKVKGWVKSFRQHKNVGFLDVNDGSCTTPLQVVISEELINTPELTFGSCVEISGKMSKSSGKEQKTELMASHVTVLGSARLSDNPLQPKRHSMEFLRTIPHLRPRTNFFSSMFRIRSTVSLSVHNFFAQRGFHCVHTPLITSNDSEGGAEVFHVGSRPSDKAAAEHFFGRQAYLTVSGQLEAEVMAASLGRVYTFGPTFRAEKNSHTTRHLAEFWMVEPEMSFADLNDVMELSEEFVKTLILDVKEKCAEDLAFFAKWQDQTLMSTIDNVLNGPFQRISYTQAMDILTLAHPKEKFEAKPAYGNDLSREHEKYLCEGHFNKPVFVFDWPRKIKPFYMKVNEDGETVACVDLLLPRVGELIGGSAREDDVQTLLESMRRNGVKEDELAWYVDLRKYGSSPHAGFGLGFERFLMFITGTQNIRDTIAMPRYPAKCVRRIISRRSGSAETSRLSSSTDLIQLLQISEFNRRLRAEDLCYLMRVPYHSGIHSTRSRLRSNSVEEEEPCQRFHFLAQTISEDIGNASSSEEEEKVLET
ncbi:asparaginyl-tRNA synthetase [Planoprotostelium fungivorum]|uniref:asparagine--tRNA ligase n=1 Tax=Planoprotostelium fungivorum TaxID=1890364 RepID=A0A2P6NBN5_9EUKA|nr:asparaginyl-tRNA synthetase [Planoprotostelium fungivorum]